MTAALPMGGQKITGMADPTVGTDAVTKQYADTQVAAFFSTGDVKMTIKTVADTGWLMCDDQTIGSATSGAAHQSAANQALFLLLFNNISDTYSAIYTSGGVLTSRAAQGSAAAAWAANCQIRLSAMLGRALGIAGAGGGLTARSLGQSMGSETASLVAGNVPQLSGSFNTNQNVVLPTSALTQVTGPSPPVALSPVTANSGQATTVVTLGSASPSAFAIMPPIVFLNAMIKL